MLPKKNRLTKKSDFDKVFKDGKSTKGDFLIFRVLKNHSKESRFGFIVSKKISNKAIIRNKIKRRLRGIIFKDLENIKKSIDVVIIALPHIKTKTFLEIKEKVNSFFKK